MRLNVSKRGISSISIGRPGSPLNLERRGVRATVGLPGTGLSYTTGSRGGGAGILALIGLAGAAFGFLFWLIGAAARGSRLAQLALGGLAAFVLFASLRSPEAAWNGPPPSIATHPTASAGTNSPAVMKTTTGANMRSGPSPQAKVVRQRRAGALVEIVGNDGRWAKVRVAGSDTTGWLARSLLASPDDLMSRLMGADPGPKSPETVFDPADISAMLRAAPSSR